MKIFKNNEWVTLSKGGAEAPMTVAASVGDSPSTQNSNAWKWVVIAMVIMVLAYVLYLMLKKRSVNAAIGADLDDIMEDL